MVNPGRLLNVFYFVLATVLVYFAYFYFASKYNIVAAIINTIDTKQYSESLEVVNKIKPSLMLVQSFASGRLLQSGNGLVLTSDGLVITLNSLVPPQADFYQIYVDSRLIRGRVVYRSNQDNLAIVNVDEGNLLPAGFAIDSLLIREERISVAVELPQNQTSPELVIGQTAQIIPGSVFVDDHGAVTGLVNTSGLLPSLIGVDMIEKTFLNYISKNIK